MSNPQWQAWNNKKESRPASTTEESASHNQKTELSDLISLTKLVFVDGYRKEEAITLLENNITLGRGLENTISFPEDTQVSREHARIYQSGENYILDVFGSNGVLFNGELLKQTQIPLQHGDLCQIGKTLIRVEVIGTPGTTETPSTHTRSLWLILVGLFVLALGGVLGGLFLFHSPKPKKKPNRVALRSIAPQPRVSNKQQERLIKLWEQGTTLAKKRKWKEALETLRKASLWAPSNVELQQQLQDIRAEMRSQSTLETVQRLLTAKHVRRCARYQNAWFALAPLSRQLAVGSVYAEAYWKLQYQVWLHMKRYCRGQKRSIPKKPTPKQVAKPTAALLTTSTKKNGVAFFNGGQIELAISYFKKRRQKKQILRLQEFVVTYRRGRKAYIHRNSKDGISLLLRAYVLDREIGKGRSVYTPQLHQMLATLYYVKGKNALEYSENYANAYSQFVRALRYVPKHKLTLSKLRDLEKQAHQWYKLALSHLQQGNKEVANRLMRRSIQMISPQSALYRKIRRKLLGP